MKIMWIYPEIPYPLTSGFLRGFHLLRLLGGRHAVTFLSLTDQKQIPPESIPALQAYAERIEIFNTCDVPETSVIKMCGLIPAFGRPLKKFWKTRCAVKQMQIAVKSLLKHQTFDLVLFHGRDALPVLDGVKVPIVVDCGDTNCARILQQMRLAGFLRWPRLFVHYVRERRMEERLARKTAYRFFISTRDRENLLGPNDRSEIVPQGVDYDYWKRSAPSSGKNCIVFSGVMSYSPNNDAALFLLEKVLPLIRPVLDGLEVLIVGRDPRPELVTVAQRYPDVTLTGFVPDVRPYLERADVFVAAVRFASGVQNKVLEAMSMEIPVVTTPVVVAGLCVDGVEPPLVVGQNADEIAAGILGLLADPVERARLSTEGRRFVETHCSWSCSAEKLEKLCLSAVGHLSGSYDPQYISGDSSLVSSK